MKLFNVLQKNILVSYLGPGNVPLAFGVFASPGEMQSSRREEP